MLLGILEALLLLLELEEAFGLGVEHEDLLLYLPVGLHKAVEDRHEVTREDGLLVIDHLRDQSCLLLAELAEPLQLGKQLRQPVAFALHALIELVCLRLAPV